MLKTIVITWTEQRSYLPSWSYGYPVAALWIAAGTDFDLNNALSHIAKENRKNMDADYRVHTFATDDNNWRAKAVAAHRNGCSL